jgi:hypothetical protein
LELSKIPKFNLTAENFPKTTHQEKEWSIVFMYLYTYYISIFPSDKEKSAKCIHGVLA